GHGASPYTTLFRSRGASDWHESRSPCGASQSAQRGEGSMRILVLFCWGLSVFACSAPNVDAGSRSQGAGGDGPASPQIDCNGGTTLALGIRLHTPSESDPDSGSCLGQLKPLDELDNVLGNLHRSFLGRKVTRVEQMHLCVWRVSLVG